MGSKIPEAIRANGTLVSALGFEQQPFGKLYCCIDGCSAELSFVKRHNRKYESKTVEIAPCFRLKRYEQHSLGCKFDLSGRLELVAKRSDSEVFRAVSASQYEFRLHILLKALWELTDYQVKRKGASWGTAGELDKRYSNKGRLTNYLRTLKQILELRELCEEKEELSSLVILDFKGHKIPWNQFFFDVSNLFEFLKFYKPEQTTPPLAISGHIKEISPPTEKFRYYQIKLESPFIEVNEQGVINKPTPEITVKDPRLLKYFKVGSEYIFFGIWYVRQRSKKGRGENSHIKWVFNNIVLNMAYKDHFIEIGL
ncbi:hypothetical protein ACEC37_001466 [Vibrio fluvialis]|nr:hypothetical protein [Vibrio fluvialis]